MAFPVVLGLSFVLETPVLFRGDPDTVFPSSQHGTKYLLPSPLSLEKEKMPVFPLGT